MSGNVTLLMHTIIKLHKQMVHKVWGQTDPPSGLDRIHFLALNVHVMSHTLYPGSLFTSIHDRVLLFMNRNRLGCWKTDLVELGIPPFLAPLLLILFKGNGPK